MQSIKLCPYCAEEIQEKAIKCKHCGEWLITKQEQTSATVRNVTNSPVSAPVAASVEAAPERPDSDIAEASLEYTTPKHDPISLESVSRDYFYRLSGGQAEPVRTNPAAVQLITSEASGNVWSATLSWVFLTALIAISVVLGTFQMYFFASEESRSSFVFLSWFEVIQQLTLARLSGGLGFSFLALAFSCVLIPLFRKEEPRPRYRTAWRANKAIAVGLAIRLLWTFALSPEAVNPSILFSAQPITKEQELALVRKVDEMFSVLNSGQKLEPETFSIEEYGEGNEVLRVMYVAFTELQSNYENFNQDIAAAGLDKVLQPENLASADGRESGLLALERLTESIQRCDDQTKQWFRDFAVKVNASMLSEQIRREMLDGFERESERIQKTMAEFFVIEREFVDAVKAIITFVSDKDQVMKVANGQMLFESAEDVATYNQHVIDIQAITQREMAWITRTGNNAAATAKNFRDEFVAPRE